MSDPTRTSKPRFKGRAVLVTGGSSGIGRAVALALGAEGARVGVAGRRGDRLEETATTIRASGGEALVLEGDVRDETVCVRWANDCEKAFGPLHGLVNAAGVLGNGGVDNTTTAEWDRIMDSNLRSVFLMTRAAAESLKRAKGSVVNLSSVASTRPYAGLAAYCVAKAALDMLTRCAALDLAPHGVRVNAINPGVVVTELHTVTQAVADYPAFLERGKATHPIGRVGNVEEVATLILYLLSDEAGWITGACMPIDGGRGLLSAR
jgi:NAD(P)-dependent dehydrogenase (short-subunit alcohol dehydrogenase family)